MSVRISSSSPSIKGVKVTTRACSVNASASYAFLCGLHVSARIGIFPMCEQHPISRRNLVEAALALAASPLLRYVPVALADQADISEIAPGVFVHQGRYEIQSPENRG